MSLTSSFAVLTQVNHTLQKKELTYFWKKGFFQELKKLLKKLLQFSLNVRDIITMIT